MKCTTLPLEVWCDWWGENTAGILPCQLEPHFATWQFGGSFPLEGGSARHLGMEFIKLAGCYGGVCGLLFLGDIRGFGSVHGILPGIWSLRETNGNVRLDLALRPPSPGEDPEAAWTPPPWVGCPVEPAFVRGRLGAHSSGLWRQFGLARMPFRAASSSLLPPLKVFRKLSSSFPYSPASTQSPGPRS